MLAANHTGTTLEINWLKGFVTFWEGRCEYFSWIFELPRYSIPHPPAKFKVCSSYQFLNQLWTNRQKIIVI